MEEKTITRVHSTKPHRCHLCGDKIPARAAAVKVTKTAITYTCMDCVSAGRRKKITNFDKITASPEALADFLASLPCLQGPWDDAFQAAFCADCPAENCDAENCHHQAERNSPAWWLAQIYTGSGPVRTDSPNPYKRQAANLRLEAMHQRDRFGRHLLAQELEGAAASIEELVQTEAMQKQEPEALDWEGDGYDEDGNIIYDIAKCRTCGHEFEEGINDWGSKYCPDCGQRLDWGGNT